MVFNLFRKKKKVTPNYFVALDIGTELLKGILFSKSKVGITALRHFYLRQPKKAMQSGRITDQELVLYGASAVLEKLLQDTVLKGTEVMLGIAGDLVNGVLVDVTYTRSNPSKAIDNKEEAEILEYVYNKIVTEAKENLSARLKIEKENLLVLHLGVVGILIDGKPVYALADNKGRGVKLSIYASFAPSDQVQMIVQIMKRLGVVPVGIVVQPYAVARAYKGSRQEEFSAIFVDIGGGTTDIALVQGGFSLQTRMYAYGGRIFTESIAKTLQVSYEIAEDLKLKYSSSMLPVETMIKVREAIAEPVRIWIDSFKVALEEFNDVTTFPDTILLCGGGAMLPDLQDTLRNYAWTTVRGFMKHPKVMVITPQQLEGVFLKDFELNRPYDVTPVALGRAYYDIMNNPKYNYVNVPKD